jgi:hypothetical protein
VPTAISVSDWHGKRLVIWSGSLQEPGKPFTLYSDGAMFDLASARWQLLPKGPRARDMASSWFDADRLIVFGGVDAMKESKGRDESLIRDAYVVDLHDLSALKWQPVSAAWKWPRDAPAMQPCHCGGGAASSGPFAWFDQALLFDGRENTVVAAPPPALPEDWKGIGWTMPMEFGLGNGRFVFVLRASTPEVHSALIFDAARASWCSFELGAKVAELLPGAQLQVVDGKLFVWAPLEPAKNVSACRGGPECPAKWEQAKRKTPGAIVSLPK